MERELSIVLRMNKCFITNVESIFKIIFNHMVEFLSLPFPPKPVLLQMAENCCLTFWTSVKSTLSSQANGSEVTYSMSRVFWEVF